jgi:hypothetical protein
VARFASAPQSRIKSRKHDQYLHEGRVAATDSLLIALNVDQRFGNVIRKEGNGSHRGLPEARRQGSVHSTAGAHHGTEACPER